MARTPKRAQTRGRKTGTSADASGLPKFSPAFVAEVGKCDSVDAFRELLDRKGIWMNRNAAQGVYEYLHSLANPTLRDEELAGVMGGVGTQPMDEAFVSTLRVLADQLD